MKPLIKKLLVVPAFLMLMVPVMGGIIDKAFQAIKNREYSKAISYFNKSINEYPSVSRYGLCLIFSDSESGYYNPDSAYILIREVENLIVMAGEKERRELDKHEINSSAIAGLRTNLDNRAFACANNVNSLTRFIEIYADSPHFKEAVRKRDSLEYSRAAEMNSSEAWYKFLDKYPESDLYFDAKSKYDQLLFFESTSEGTVQAYENFIIAYPDNSMVQYAYRQLYKLSTSGSIDPQSIYNYILNYPESPIIPDAWQRIYDLSVPEYTADNITAFMEKYPDYPDKDRLRSDFVHASSVMIPFELNGKWGFVNDEGMVITTAVYDTVYPFVNGVSHVVTGTKHGFVMKSGEELIPPFYDEATGFYNNYAVVKVGGKAGVINRQGKMIVPLIYTDVGRFNEQLATATDGKATGFINPSGDTIISFRYISAGEFNNGTAVCKDQNGYGIVKRDGTEIIPCNYPDIENFQGNVCKFKTGSGWGLMNRLGNVVTEPVFDEIGDFKFNRASIVKSGRAGFINDEGSMNVVPKFETDSSKSFLNTFTLNGYALVKLNDRFGIIDTSGNFVISPAYTNIKWCDPGIAGYENNGLWGLQNAANGKILVQNRYLHVDSLINGYIIASKKSGYGVIDLRGKEMIPLTYDSLYHLTENMYAALKDSLWVVVDVHNQRILPSGFISVVTHDIPGFITADDGKGKIIYDINRKRIIIPEIY